VTDHIDIVEQQDIGAILEIARGHLLCTQVAQQGRLARSHLQGKPEAITKVVAVARSDQIDWASGDFCDQNGCSTA
jgi:hypothetical protein